MDWVDTGVGWVPTVKMGILSAQTEVHRAIETQTEIGWLHMFRGFVSIYWVLENNGSVDIKRRCS